MIDPYPAPSRSEIQSWRKLRLEKYRRREGLFLAEGVKVVRELERSARSVSAVLVRRDRGESWPSLMDSLAERAPVYAVREEDWKGLSQDVQPEGIIAVVPVAEREEPAVVLSRKTGPVLCLHEVNNPNNLGALIRTAHWFGIGTILLDPGTVSPTNPKAVRASMGSLFHLNILEDVDLREAIPVLKKHGPVAAAVAAGGMPPHAGGASAILLGSESHGLPEDLLALADERWTIPGKGDAESLSLPQAAAILMYAWTAG
ncbi:MAG: RNA methyltransferase [Syntrophaceae bacterium]|nr:RNA methyltransferase [Syntrophaceae bacterium]